MTYCPYEVHMHIPPMPPRRGDTHPRFVNQPARAMFPGPCPAIMPTSQLVYRRARVAVAPTREPRTRTVVILPAIGALCKSRGQVPVSEPTAVNIRCRTYLDHPPRNLQPFPPEPDCPVGSRVHGSRGSLVAREGTEGKGRRSGTGAVGDASRHPASLRVLPGLVSTPSR